MFVVYHLFVFGINMLQIRYLFVFGIKILQIRYLFVFGIKMLQIRYLFVFGIKMLQIASVRYIYDITNQLLWMTQTTVIVTDHLPYCGNTKSESQKTYNIHRNVCCHIVMGGYLINIVSPSLGISVTYTMILYAKQLLNRSLEFFLLVGLQLPFKQSVFKMSATVMLFCVFIDDFRKVMSKNSKD